MSAASQRQLYTFHAAACSALLPDRPSTSFVHMRATAAVGALLACNFVGGWVQRRVTIAELAWCGWTTNIITMSHATASCKERHVLQGCTAVIHMGWCGLCMMAAKCTQTPAYSSLASKVTTPHCKASHKCGQGTCQPRTTGGAVGLSGVSSSTICLRAHTQTAGAGLVRADSLESA